MEKADTIKAFAKWPEKDGVARAAILVALTNTLFDIHSSDSYSAKLLWEKLDQIHNTDSQGLEKYFVARFLKFKLVDNKSMTKQVHEFEMIVHALKESGMELPEKFKVMSVIEKLPKSWEEFSLSLKRQKGEITWTNLMLDISVQEQHKSKQGHVMPTEYGTWKVNIATVGQKMKAFAKKANSNKPNNDKDKAKKPKANKPCWSCGQVGHWSKDCLTKWMKYFLRFAETIKNFAVIYLMDITEVPDFNTMLKLDAFVVAAFILHLVLIDVPSPLVPTRENYFVKYCKQHDSGTWAVADVSLDNLRSASISRCRRRPSGCLIQEMPNGYFRIKFSLLVALLYHEQITYGENNSKLLKHPRSSLLEVKLQVANCDVDDRLYWSCANCLYDLCLVCCRELRGCSLHGSQEKVIMQHINPRMAYMHGKKTSPFSNNRETSCMPAKIEDICHAKSESDWKIDEHGKKNCPPESMGGRGQGVLVLKQVLPDNWILSMLAKAEELYEFYKLKDMPNIEQWCSCSSLSCDNVSKDNTIKAASRHNSDDNYLYSPSAVDIQAGDLKHFQAHWSKGEPVIVSNVFDTTSDLSWEPEVMSRAIQEMKSQPIYVITLNCFDWREVLVPEHKRKKLGPKTVDCIFLGYLETTTTMRFLVLKSDLDGIMANTIVEFRDATFFEDVYPMKTGIPETTSEEDPTHTSSSIHDHMEKMTNMGAEPSSSSIPKEV
ncbi:hypothetical protein AgCh_037602 [Apium graveolens]